MRAVKIKSIKKIEHTSRCYDIQTSLGNFFANGVLVHNCFIYFCPATNKWELGTRGTAFSEGPNEWHGTFRQAMLDAMGLSEEEFQSTMNKYNITRLHNITRLYEFISPENRIVTPYKESMLVLLAYVNNSTGEEMVAPKADLERAMGWNVREVREYKFDTLEHCLATLHDLPDLQEGYVIYNHVTKERIKMKSPAYVAAHRIRGNGLTLNSICELVAMGEVDEYISVFPEDKAKFEPALFELTQMEVTLKFNYEQFKDIETQKDFALQIKDLPLSGVMFKARKNGTDIIHEFNQFPVNRRADWLKDRLISK